MICYRLKTDQILKEFKSEVSRHVLTKGSQLVESLDANCFKLDAGPRPIMSSKSIISEILHDLQNSYILKSC